MSPLLCEGFGIDLFGAHFRWGVLKQRGQSSVNSWDSIGRVEADLLDHRGFD